MVKKVNAIDTSVLFKKRQSNKKISEIEGKITSITGLASTATLTAVENNIPNVTDLVKRKKTDYEENMKDIEGKYFTTSDYYKFSNDILDVKIKNKELVNKSDNSGQNDKNINNKIRIKSRAR